MSFVRSAEDIRNLKALIDQYRPGISRPLIFAKIEKPDAVEQIEEILQEVDGIMVARGDLGIEVEAEKVPIIQKQLIHQAILYGKRVIVATQMLDSMIRNPRPTRAEVSDVANAVIDHTDAVMLSGETSGGIYPLQAVEMMRRIILATEESTYDDYVDEYFQVDDIKNIHRELAYGAQHLARQSEAHGIVVFDWDGLGIAEYMSEFRTEVPVFVITANERYYYQTGLTWGVTGVLVDDSTKSEMHTALGLVKKRHFKRVEQEEQYFVVVDVTHKNKESIQMYLV
jgi:pyruvate kinase